MTSGISCLPREEDEVDGPVGSRAKHHCDHTDESARDHEREHRTRLRTSGNLVREMPYADDHPGDHHGQGDAPRQVGHPHAVVGGQRRQRQVFLVQPLPVADTREDERSRRGGDKPRQESPHDRRRGNRTAHGDELEQHDRRRKRPSEQRRYGRKGSGQHEQLCLRLLEAHEPHSDRSHPQAEGDQRRLGPEHEPEAEGRQAREQDAGQLDGLNRRRRDPLERRVAAVAREGAGTAPRARPRTPARGSRTTRQARSSPASAERPPRRSG